MCDQTEVQYLPGEVVWVKLRALWWPGQVQDYDNLPEEITGSLRKRPLAVVKFFQEDTYEYVNKLDLIYHYNCSRKYEFIKKGLDLSRKKTNDRPSNMDLFPTDVVRAEHLTNGNPNVINEDVFKPEEKPKYEALFGGEKKKIGKKRGKDETPPKTPGSWRLKPMGWHSRGKSPSVVKPPSDVSRVITHHRFIQKALNGTSDYEVHIREQKRSTSPNPQKEYQCVSCGFVTCRLNVIVIHFNITHSPKTKEASSPRPKVKPRSVRTPASKVKLESRNSESPVPVQKVACSVEVEVAGDNEENKVVPKPSKKRVKIETVEDSEAKKPKVVATLLADWEEDAEQEQQEQQLQEERDRQRKEEEDRVASEVETSSSLKSKEVFEFDEDDGIDFDLTQNVKGFGRRIPRLIDVTKDKRKEKAKEENNDIDEINEEINSLLADTAVPSLPDVPVSDKVTAPEKEMSKNLMPEVELAVDSNIPPQGNGEVNTAMGNDQSDICHENDQSGKKDGEQPEVAQKEMQDDKLVVEQGEETGEEHKEEHFVDQDCKDSDEHEKVKEDEGEKQDQKHGAQQREVEVEHEEEHKELSSINEPEEASLVKVINDQTEELEVKHMEEEIMEQEAAKQAVPEPSKMIQKTGQSTSGGDHNYVIGGSSNRKRRRSLPPIDRSDSELGVDAMPVVLDERTVVEESIPGNRQPVFPGTSNTKQHNTMSIKSPKRMKNLSPDPRSPKSPPPVISMKNPGSPHVTGLRSPRSPHKSPPHVGSLKSPKIPKSPPVVKTVKSTRSPPVPSPKSRQAGTGIRTPSGLRSPRSPPPLSPTKSNKTLPVPMEISPAVETPQLVPSQDRPLLIKKNKGSPAFIVKSTKATPSPIQSQTSSTVKGGQAVPGSMKTIKVSLPSGVSTPGKKYMIVQSKAGIVQSKAGPQSPGPQTLMAGGKRYIFVSKGPTGNIILTPQQQKILASGGQVTATSSKAAGSVPSVIGAPIGSPEPQGSKSLKVIKSTTVKGQLQGNVVLNTPSGQILVPLSSMSTSSSSPKLSPGSAKSYILPVGGPGPGQGPGGKVMLQPKVMLPAVSKTMTKPQQIKLISGPGQQVKMASMVVPGQSVAQPATPGKIVRQKMITKPTVGLGKSAAASPGRVAVMSPGRPLSKSKGLQSTTKGPVKGKTGIIPNPLLKKNVAKTDTTVVSPVIKKLSTSPSSHTSVSEVATLPLCSAPATTTMEQLLAGTSTGTQQLVAVPTEDGGQVMYLIDNSALLGLDESGQPVDSSGSTLFINSTSQGNLGNLILTFDNGSMSGAAASTSSISSTPSSGQDILAEALANTQVLQCETPATGTDVSLLASSSSTCLYPTSVPTLSHGVLETSLTLNQPIMTPLEDLSAVSSLQPPPTTSSTIELPITITQPDITISTSSYSSLPIPSATIQSTVFSDSQHVSSFSSVPMLATETDAGVFLEGDAFISAGSSDVSMPLLDTPE